METSEFPYPGAEGVDLAAVDARIDALVADVAEEMDALSAEEFAELRAELVLRAAAARAAATDD